MNEHSLAREYFFLLDGEPCLAERLLSITENKGSDQNILIAYQGAAHAVMAECLRHPYLKLRQFNLGKTILDRAVEREPYNPEIRFIRFMIQDRAPGFLGYDNRREDLFVLVEYFNNRMFQEKVDEFDIKMGNALLASDFPARNQKECISIFIDQCKILKIK